MCPLNPVGKIVTYCKNTYLFAPSVFPSPLFFTRSVPQIILNIFSPPVFVFLLSYPLFIISTYSIFYLISSISYFLLFCLYLLINYSHHLSHSFSYLFLFYVLSSILYFFFIIPICSISFNHQIPSHFLSFIPLFPFFIHPYLYCMVP